MRVSCEKCQAEYDIDEARVPAAGLQIKCPRCSTIFIVTKPGASETSGEILDFGEIATSALDSQEPIELDLPEEPETATAFPPLPQRPAPSPRPDPRGSTLPPLAGRGPATAPPAQRPAVQPSASSLPRVPPPAAPQPPVSGSEGEIFDFIDHGIDDESEAGEEAQTLAPRFRIRRKSGKVFGPFDVETINKMLTEHQLMGNEEASLDGYTFKALGSFQEFTEKIRSLVDEPVISAPVPQPVRTASVTAVEEEDEEAQVIAPRGLEFAQPPAPKARKPRRLLPLLLAGAALVVVLAGLGLGFTRFGFFGIGFFSSLFSGSDQTRPETQSSSDNVVSATSGQMRSFFLQDTFSGYRSVTQNLERTIKEGDDSVENLYLLGLSYAALLRNYGADEGYLKRLRETIEKLKDKASSAPETAKADAALKILSDPGQALTILEPLIGEQSRDREALFLAGWATAYQQKWEQAARFFDRVTVIDPDGAMAYHAMGDLQSLQGDFENALLFYKKALEKDPAHNNSGVELARILIEIKKDDPEGERILNQVFGMHFQGMAPTEQAKAHYLRSRISLHRHENEKVVQDLNAAIQLVPSRADYLAALGDFDLEIGEFQKALGIFEKALALDPKNVDSMVGMGRALWQSGAIDKAKISLQQTTAQAKDDPRPLYYLGRIAEDLENPLEAMDFYERAAKLAPQFLLARLAVASLQLKQGKVREALELLTAAVRNNPRSAIVLNGLGEVYFAQKNFRLAKEELTRALQLDPQLLSARFNLANTYRDNNELDAALAEYEKVLASAPKYPELGYEYANALFLAKKPAEALKTYEKVILGNPKDDRLYVGAGLAAEAVGDLETAKKYFQTATGLNSGNVEGYYRMALLFQRQNEHEGALELFKRAIELDKTRADIHYSTGVSLMATDLVPDAIDEFRETIKLKPNHVDGLLALGNALSERSQLDEAVPFFERVAREQPRRIDVLLALGDTFSKQGFFPKAEKVFLRAYRLAPTGKGVTYRLGRAYDEMNKRTLAIKFYELAVKTDATDPMPHFYLGHLYKAMNKNKIALTQFQQYLKLRPDAPDADEVKDEIYYLKNG